MSLKKINKLLILVMSVFFLTAVIGRAEGDKKGKSGQKETSLQKTSAQIGGTYLDINKLSTNFYNNGVSDLSPKNVSGLVYPKGSGKTAAFETGFLWGAYVDGDPNPRVNGSTYGGGLQPGKVLANGQADDPTKDIYSIYRVRPDVGPNVGANLNLDAMAANEGTSAAALRAQFIADWNNWPAALGAPYKDVDNNGVYDPNIDIPGVPGADMTIWFVANDLNVQKSTQFYGAQPLGIEMQCTVWAYNSAGPLGNMFFKRYKLINITDRTSSPKTFHKMIVSSWSDVDLGDATDDFVGVDTLASLQYCYNAGPTDAVYDPLPPPATGFDFFQGPRLKGVAGEDLNKNGRSDDLDTAIYNGSRWPGYINLPVTAAYYFANGDDNIGDPPLGSDIQGSIEFYHFMEGRFGISGKLFTNLATGLPTTFALSGDPVTGTGWLDGVQLPKGDRRQGMASGPFEMAPGDTQEVVVAEIVAGATPGSDNIKAITTLRQYDAVAQDAYDQFFVLPSAPPAPKVVATPLDQEIVLNWGLDSAAVRKTESDVNKNYVFQGYNVYQLPTASSDKPAPNADITKAGLRIATYDIVDTVTTILDNEPDPTSGVIVTVAQQFGTNSGIKRSIDIKQDWIHKTPLINGVKYYFAVTAYSYSPNPLDSPNNLENPLAIITVVPQSTAPGVRLTASTNDTLKVTHATGASDGKVVSIVVDPTKLTGDNYTVKFTKNGVDTNKAAVADEWHLYDNTTSKVVYSSKNLSGSATGTLVDSANYYPIVDGFNINVSSPPEGINHYSVTGTRWVTGVNWGGAEFFGGLDIGANFFGSDVVATDYFPVELKFTDNPVMSEANGWSQGAAMLQSAGYAVQGKGWMPFQAFDITDPANPRQINVSFRYNNATPTKLVWDMSWDGTKYTDPSLGGRNYTFIHKTSYNPDMYLNPALDPTYNDVLYALWPAPRGTHPYLEAKFTMDIVPNYPVLVGDTYTFKTSAPTNSTSTAKSDVQSVNVFPNPYYGVNSQELNKYNRFVTFNHLPDNATIRIFNIAGVMVRTIVKSGGDQFQRWDLLNESGLPVASGLYIAYIDMGSLGTKILKFSIIQEQQILDRLN